MAELGGFDVEELLDCACLLNVVDAARDGLHFANVSSIMCLPKGMEPLQPRDYVRVKDRQGQNGLSVVAEETTADLDDVPF